MRAEYAADGMANPQVTEKRIAFPCRDRFHTAEQAQPRCVYPAGSVHQHCMAVDSARFCGVRGERFIHGLFPSARDLMLEATDNETAPWYIAQSDDKKRARLNCITHLLSLIPYTSDPPKWLASCPSIL
jgi:Polyphosphate kinase 2 (PPK2)